MTEVKSALRALKLFEAFADSGRAMSLSQIAAALEMAPSSSLLLIRTLVGGGYLYGTGKRQHYFPTRRLQDIISKIAHHDPIMERVQPYLDALRDQTSETVSFATLQGDNILIIGVAESAQMLRFTIPVGTVRPPHVLASGKALLATLDTDTRRRLIQRLELKPFTPRTVTTREALEADIEAGRAHGYYTGFGDGILELGSLAVPVTVDGEAYSLGISGPLSKIESQQRELAAMAKSIGARMAGELNTQQR